MKVPHKKVAKKAGQILRSAEKIPALRKLGPDALPWTVDVQMVGRVIMTRLNTHYRGKRKPTDVLSFSAPDPFRSAGYLGELVICTPVLKQQAKALGLREDEELQVLLVHGVLHLLGLDHELSLKEDRRMARFEKKLLEATGFDLEGLCLRA